MMNFAWVFALVLTTTALGDDPTPACLIGFANTAPGDPESEALIRTTYLDLFEKLGAGVTPETLRQMRSGQNPFEVPEQAETDLHSLRRRLKEFQAMIREKEWDTPAAKERLLTELEKLAVRRSQLEAAKEEALRTTVVEEPIVIPKAGTPILSPDGRYLATWRFDRTSPDKTLLVYDRQTNQLREYTRPTDDVHLGSAFFSPRNDSIWFAMKNGDLKRVPFLNGVPDWKNERTVGDETGNLTMSFYKAAANGHDFYVSLGSEAYRVNPQTGTRVKLNFKDYLKDEKKNELRRFQVVPGGNRLSVMTVDRENQQTKLELVEVDTQGNLTPVAGSLTQWKTRGGQSTGLDPEYMVYSRDGKKAYLWGHNADGGFAVIDKPGAQPRWLFDGRTNGSHVTVREILTSPHNNDVVVLYSEGITMKEWAEVRDATTQRVRGTFPKPEHANNFSFSPDGAFFYATGNDHVYLIDYNQRVAP